jgi:hypothetical protein
LPEFILLDLLGGDTHQVSQSIQTQTSLKASLLQAVANMDVDWMNFCPLGGSVHRYRFTLLGIPRRHTQAGGTPSSPILVDDEPGHLVFHLWPRPIALGASG